MKREEIEELLAEYVSGEISPARMLTLEELFAQDPALKQEATELAASWTTLDDIAEADRINAARDRDFYSVLEEAKAGPRSSGPRIIKLPVSWLKAGVAAAACMAAFVAGRSTAEPEMREKVRTVYVQQKATGQMPVALKELKIAPAAILPTRKDALKTGQKAPVVNSALAQELRSVYTSERISAVMQITASGNLTDADLKLLDLALREDPSPNVRLTILDALRPVATRKNVQAVLINLLKQPADDLIKASVVDLLVDTKSTQAIPQMIAMLEDKDTNSRIQDKIRAGIESFLN